MGFRKHVMETREPLAIHEDMDAALVTVRQPCGRRRRDLERLGDLPAARRRRPGDRRRSRSRTSTTSTPSAPSDQQLLSTIAGSLGVALENAQLIHETRQRVAELGTVNSVGQALATQLDLDELIHLVGERVRETFDADIAYVALHDEAADVIEFPYNWELGEHISRAADAVRRGPDLADHRVGRAAPRGQRRHRRRPAGRRHPVEVLPRRPDLGPRPGDRRDQRPEHTRGRAIRRGRHAPARDARRQRRRGDPERAPLRRDRSPEGVLRVARRHQPGRGDRDGCRGNRDRLEPGRRRAVRLLAGGGDRAPDRRPRVRRGASPRGPRDHRGGRGERACASNHPAHPQGRHAGRRRADARPAHRRRRARGLPRHLPRHHRAPAGARGGRGGDAGEERVPGDDEPRDPDADERRDRHDRPAARHRADAGAAGVRRGRALERRRARCT